MEIVANIANWSYFGQFAIIRTIQKTCDPVWLSLIRLSNYLCSEWRRIIVEITCSWQTNHRSSSHIPTSTHFMRKHGANLKKKKRIVQVSSRHVALAIKLTDWLVIYCFRSHSRIFHLYGDVTDHYGLLGIYSDPDHHRLKLVEGGWSDPWVFMQSKAKTDTRKV